MEIKQSSEMIYDGKIIKVSKDQVMIADNHALAMREVVRHPGGVSILAIDQGKILLIQQFRYVIGKDLYEIPAGKLEQGEDPLMAAHRELEEETGYQCKKLTKICAMLSSPGFLDEQVTIYEASKLYQPLHPLTMDEDERISLHRFSFEEAYHMIQNGEITDAKTIIAVQHAILKKNLIFKPTAQTMTNKNELLLNLQRLHTTKLGEKRIKQNLSSHEEDIVAWCKAQIQKEQAIITRNGKNWYVEIDDCMLTIHATSYTIITAQSSRKK